MKNKTNIKLNFRNARNDEQLKIMTKAKNNGICPFCPQHFEKYHPKPIIFKTENWTVTENAWPYKNTQYHFLLVSKRHRKNFKELNKNESAEIPKIISKLEKKFKLPNKGLIFFRFGDITKTGATIQHLHGHIIIPKGNISLQNFT